MLLNLKLVCEEHKKSNQAKHNEESPTEINELGLHEVFACLFLELSEALIAAPVDIFDNLLFIDDQVRVVRSQHLSDAMTWVILDIVTFDHFRNDSFNSFAMATASHHSTAPELPNCFIALVFRYIVTKVELADPSYFLEVGINILSLACRLLWIFSPILVLDVAVAVI